MTKTQKETLGYALIAIAALLSLIGILVQSPIAQDVSYHLFKDSKTIWSVPNFGNVVSNIPFLIVGTLGLFRLLLAKDLNIIAELRIAYVFLFLGTALVGLGSGYYHLRPDNQTLVWDRLPMTLAFMSLFSIVISEHHSIRMGRALLVPLLMAGVASVAYWHYSEARGEGDLRYYALVQFFPLLAIPVLLSCFRSACTRTGAYWWLLLAYVAAKLLEHFDAEVYSALGFISGHSLKHVAAALGMYILLISYGRRTCT